MFLNCADVRLSPPRLNHDHPGYECAFGADAPSMRRWQPAIPRTSKTFRPRSSIPGLCEPLELHSGDSFVVDGHQEWLPDVASRLPRPLMQSA